MNEPDVIRATKQYLERSGLAGHRVAEIYTDAHPSLVRYSDLKPFQRFTLPLDGLQVHPDLVGRLDDGETLFAIEAKGDMGEALHGLTQASSYRAGFHRSLLALPSDPSGEIRSLAHQFHVGLIVVHQDAGVVLELPAAHLPRYEPAKAITRQFTATTLLTIGFSLNMPTHYLSVPVALNSAAAHGDDIETQIIRHYRVMPHGELASSVRGALKLGLITRRGDDIRLTVAGEAAAQLLPDLPTLAQIHREVKAQRGATIDQVSPATGAILRWLLVADPIVALILTSLHALGAESHSMVSLARMALERDRSLAQVTMFLPEALADILDRHGRVSWSRVTPAHFRTTIRYQYKSLMRQAGLLVPHPLGASQSSRYDPSHDLWELAARPPFTP